MVKLLIEAPEQFTSAPGFYWKHCQLAIPG